MSTQFINDDPVYKHPKLLGFLLNLNFWKNNFRLYSGMGKEKICTLSLTPASQTLKCIVPSEMKMIRVYDIITIHTYMNFITKKSGA